MKRIKRALVAGIGTLGLLSGAAGVAATLAPAAAHAATNESYTDLTAEANCFGGCSEVDVMQAAANNLVDVVAGISPPPTPTTWSVTFNGHWCLNDGNGYLGVTGTDALIDNYSSSCNLGGDEWEINCRGTGFQYQFYLSNVHTGDYVDYNTAGVYHADGLIGDVFEDRSHTECA